MKNNNAYGRVNGFTLIEVLIGVFVAAVGIVGVLEIQKHVIKSGNVVNAYAIAMQMAREKIDDTKNIDDFSLIVTGSDNAVEKSNYTFTRSWKAVSYAYDEDNNNWAEAGVGVSVDAKNLVVSVSWSDINGETQTVVQNQVLSKVSLHDSTTATDTSSPKGGPKVPFNEISSIENPPISLVDDVNTYPDYDTKETSKPVPTIDARAGNNVIQFETVTYDTSSDKQTLEDFVTLNCSCNLSGGQSDGVAPTILTIAEDGDSLIEDENSGQTVTKPVGTADSGQNFLCDQCCEDHHDSDDVDAKYVAGTSSGDHPHYNENLNLVTGSGDYVEACRFRRIDGFYELVPDWQLADIIIMPKSYFVDDANVSAYVSYVKAVVQAKLMNNPATMPDKGTLGIRDMANLVAGEYQLIARGIYVDTGSLSSSDLAKVQSYVSGANYKPNWLEYVPFYEINLSLFADWESSEPSIATITNEDISTIVDPDTDYYGTYSRGWLTAIANGDTTISGVARTDNTGITGSGAIIPQDADYDPDVVDSTPPETHFTDSITANVNIEAGDDAEVGSRSLSIDVSCVKYRNNGTLTTCSGQDGRNLNLNYSAGLTCSDGVEASFPSYSSPNLTCNGISDTWSSGWVSLAYPGFLFYLSSADESTAVAELVIYINMDLVTGDPKQFTESVVMVKQ